MKFCAFFVAAWCVAANAIAATSVLLDAPVRVTAETSSGAGPNKTALALTIRHGTSEFTLSVSQRGNAGDALAAQKSTSGWKEGYLFIRDDCLADDPAATVWRCVVDHVFALAEIEKSTSGARLIYVGSVFAGEECIESKQIGCALYKGVFTDIYDRLESNALTPRTEAPALLIESTVRGGVFQVDLIETWKANQERFIAGGKCLAATQEMQKERCVEGITPRGAYLFNAALATYARQDEPLARTRAFARAALCESARAKLSESECSAALRASALMMSSVKPGERPRARGNVSSGTVKETKTKL